jgi:hypothetical protein
VDALQAEVMTRAAAHGGNARAETFAAIAALARADAGLPPLERTSRRPAPVPTVTEPWYCCAEPTPQQLGAI